MTYQYSITVADARLDQIQTTIGPSPVLKLFSGPEPANCASPDPSGLLCTMTLPAVWMNPASGGVKTLTGLWQGFASSPGTIACWRIYDSGGNCHIQGSVADMIFTSTTPLLGQTIQIITFQITAGNQ